MLLGETCIPYEQLQLVLHFFRVVSFFLLESTAASHTAVFFASYIYLAGIPEPVLRGVVFFSHVDLHSRCDPCPEIPPRSRDIGQPLLKTM